MTPVQLLNLSLLKIGVSKGVSAIDDASREAYTGALVFDHLLRATLRQFPWSFATKYLPLTQTQGPTTTDAENVQAWASGQIYAVGDIVTSGGTIYACVLAHTAATPGNIPPNTTYWSTDAEDFAERANGDWDYAYRWPSDCLYGRRMVPEGGHGRLFNETPIPFRVGRDANGELFYTNQRDAVLEYTVIDCDHLWADDLFIDAFTWRLAAYLAPSLARDDKVTKTCIAMYPLAIELAATVSSREQQQEKNGDAEWTNAR